MRNCNLKSFHRGTGQCIQTSSCGSHRKENLDISSYECGMRVRECKCDRNRAKTWRSSFFWNFFDAVGKSLSSPTALSKCFAGDVLRTLLSNVERGSYTYMLHIRVIGKYAYETKQVYISAIKCCYVSVYLCSRVINMWIPGNNNESNGNTKQKKWVSTARYWKWQVGVCGCVKWAFWYLAELGQMKCYKHALISNER